MQCCHFQNTQFHTMRIRLLASNAKRHSMNVPSREVKFPKKSTLYIIIHIPMYPARIWSMTARFPLLQFLDLKCCYVYPSTSLEAVNDDNDELSHQDLHMRCKHLSIHSNCKVYVVPTRAMQYTLIFLNLGTKWSVVTWPFYFHGPLTHAQHYAG